MNTWASKKHEHYKTCANTRDKMIFGTA